MATAYAKHLSNVNKKNSGPHYTHKSVKNCVMIWRDKKKRSFYLSYITRSNVYKEAKREISIPVTM